MTVMLKDASHSLEQLVHFGIMGGLNDLSVDGGGGKEGTISEISLVYTCTKLCICVPKKMSIWNV